MLKKRVAADFVIRKMLHSVAHEARILARIIRNPKR